MDVGLIESSTLNPRDGCCGGLEMASVLVPDMTLTPIAYFVWLVC